jgi:hypothetical protein
MYWKVIRISYPFRPKDFTVKTVIRRRELEETVGYILLKILLKAQKVDGLTQLMQLKSRTVASLKYSEVLKHSAIL